MSNFYSNPSFCYHLRGADKQHQHKSLVEKLTNSNKMQILYLPETCLCLCILRIEPNKLDNRDQYRWAIGGIIGNGPMAPPPASHGERGISEKRLRNHCLSPICYLTLRKPPVFLPECPAGGPRTLRRCRRTRPSGPRGGGGLRWARLRSIGGLLARKPRTTADARPAACKTCLVN